MKNIGKDIVVLCGSTKFYETFNAMNVKFTLEGKIVLSIGDHTKGDHGTVYEDYKVDLDELHKRKIELATEVFVINKFGYIGDSTRSEIDFAKKIGRPIKYMENPEKHLYHALEIYNQSTYLEEEVRIQGVYDY